MVSGECGGGFYFIKKIWRRGGHFFPFFPPGKNVKGVVGVVEIIVRVFPLTLYWSPYSNADFECWRGVNNSRTIKIEPCQNHRFLGRSLNGRMAKLLGWGRMGGGMPASEWVWTGLNYYKRGWVFSLWYWCWEELCSQIKYFDIVHDWGIHRRLAYKA